MDSYSFTYLSLYSRQRVVRLTGKQTPKETKAGKYIVKVSERKRGERERDRERKRESE